MRYGSLCSGIGGLDRAVETVWPNASPAWFCEFDQHAARVLARHWPGVPILPDLKTQDWSTVERVELVTAGYPCQPFSHAGKRQGAADPRHLWPSVIDAVRVLRPRLVVLENVAGHLGLGFDEVLGDLAEAGFDAEWSVVPASAAGACHRRERLFVVAADTSGERHGRGQERAAVGAVDARAAGEAWQRERPWPEPVDRGAETRRRRSQPRATGTLATWAEDVADADGGRFQECSEPHRGPHEPRIGASRRPDADGRDAALADAAHVGREWGGDHGDGGPDLRTVVAHAHRVAGTTTASLDRSSREMDESGAVAGVERLRCVDWGDYGAAIHRWEHVIGRPAPAPVDEKGRLSVTFVEWMQGFDAGWVDGLTRTAALRCLGNAVVQQQGVLAISALTNRRAFAGSET